MKILIIDQLTVKLFNKINKNYYILIFYLGTNIISELFSTMTSRMHFTDVWQLVLGNPVGPRINQARQSAIEYLQ